jgi:phosphatidylglycerol:prolipoprotein diacylglycerol transferase
MSTHGILLGAVAGTWLFCRRHGKRFLVIADELVVPGAFLMGIGRIGNFIDGQIVGRPTDRWWGVQFPDAEGFRHPVVLYDGMKNLLLIPLLLTLRRRRPPPGRLTAHFIFWYGFLRIPVDVFRVYPGRLFGLATGQSFNVLMSVLGAALFRLLPGAPMAPSAAAPVPSPAAGSLWTRRLVFALLLLFPLVLPSDWTQDVPARYGKRHPGMGHSILYPAIATP